MDDYRFAGVTGNDPSVTNWQSVSNDPDQKGTMCRHCVVKILNPNVEIRNKSQIFKFLNDQNKLLFTMPQFTIVYII